MYEITVRDNNYGTNDTRTFTSACEAFEFAERNTYDEVNCDVIITRDGDLIDLPELYSDGAEEHEQAMRDEQDACAGGMNI